MICPLDEQPCTLDHSNECADRCERQLRQLRREKIRRMIERQRDEGKRVS